VSGVATLLLKEVIVKLVAVDVGLALAQVLPPSVEYS
jgi:hypothetical protein